MNATLLQTIIAASFVLVGTILTIRTGAKTQSKGQDILWFEKLSGRINELDGRVISTEEEANKRGRLLGIACDFLDEVSLYLIYRTEGDEFPKFHPELGFYCDENRWVKIAERFDKKIVTITYNVPPELVQPDIDAANEEEKKEKP